MIELNEYPNGLEIIEELDSGIGKKHVFISDPKDAYKLIESLSRYLLSFSGEKIDEE